MENEKLNNLGLSELSLTDTIATDGGSLCGVWYCVCTLKEIADAFEQGLKAGYESFDIHK